MTLLARNYDPAVGSVGGKWLLSDILGGGYTAFGNVWYVNGATGNDTFSGQQNAPYATIQAAVNAASSGDVIVIGEGAYDETVTIARTLDGLTLIGQGNQGAIGIAPTTTAAVGLINNADDVTLINVGVAGESTAAYAAFSTGSRFRIYGGKIEGVDTSGSALVIGPGSVAQVSAGTAGNCGDVNLYDCEFAWSHNGLALTASDYGVPTQVYMQNCRMHNIDGTEVLGVPGAFGIGSVRNLMVKNCLFEAMEDGTNPSDYVNVNDASDTGIFTANQFAIPTNAIADLKVGAGVMWVANATEAGWSTARPA